MEKFKGTSTEEFRKWAADNWEEIEMAFEKALEEYNEETRENLVDYSSYFMEKPIKICSEGTPLVPVEYIEFIDEIFEEEN